MPSLSQENFTPSDTLLVLDLFTGAWLGQWRSPHFRLRYFAPFYDGDEPRVAILGFEGECHAMFPPAPPQDDAGTSIVLEARAAVRADLQQSVSTTLVAEVECLGGRYRLAYEADGMGETGALRSRAPDPAASLRFGGTVDLENDGDVLQDPYREDYSHEIPEDGTWLYEAGWELGARQRHHETARLPRRLRGAVLACAGDTGRVAFRSLALVSTNKPVARGSRV